MKIDSKSNKDLYIFLGSYIESEKFNYLIENYCKSNISASNSEYERMLFLGFKNHNYNCKFISCPPVGRWPFSCKKLHLEKLNGLNDDIIYCKYSTLFFINNFSKERAIKKELKKLCKLNKNKNINVISCEMHGPYLGAAKYVAKKYNCKIMSIVPDLPDFIRYSNNYIYKILKKIDIKRLYSISNKYVSSFVLFTDEMKDKFKLNNKNYIIREGGIDKISPINNHNENKKTICTFTGSVNKENGIDIIINAAKNCKDIEFNIYGSGNMEQILKNLDIKNIKYHGFINPKNIESVCLNSDILISPRLPKQNFASYSFPSKILKYISYNKPIVAYKLPCFKEKYNNLIIYPNTQTVDSFVKAIYAAKKEINNNRIGLIKEKLSNLFVDNLILDMVKLLSSQNKGDKK